MANQSSLGRTRFNYGTFRRARNCADSVDGREALRLVIVQVDPLIALRNADLHRRMNFPQRTAPIANLPGLFWVEAQPTADPHFGTRRSQRIELVQRPACVVGAHARRYSGDECL